MRAGGPVGKPRERPKQASADRLCVLPATPPRNL